MPIDSRSVKIPTSTSSCNIDQIDIRACVSTAYRHKKGSYRPCRAFDFETYQGFGVLLADDSGSYVCSTSPKPFFTFLLRKELQDTYNFFYNIQFDFQSLIKYLPISDYKRLYHTGKAVLPNYLREGYDLVITYIPKKRFSLTHRNRSRSGKSYVTTHFYDLAQFFRLSLDEAGKKYSTFRKGGQDLDAERINTSIRYWKDHYDDIVKYCIRDCELTADLARRVQYTTHDKFNFYPSHYTSQAGLASEYVLLNCTIPDIHMIPKRVLDLSLESYTGGWFECMAKGTFDKIYLYDINSAYPFEIRNLLDITVGQWRVVKDYNPDAYYGFYRCTVCVSDDDEYIPSIPFRTPQNVIVRPTGRFSTVLHKSEIEACSEFVKINIISGVEFYPEEYVYPFRALIDTLYAWKEHTDRTHYEYDHVKKVMNSIYGKTYEKVPIKTTKGVTLRAGKLFNPVYASLITKNTQMRIWKTMMQRPQDIVLAATDGIISQSPLHVPISKKLGMWSYEGSGRGEVLQNGIYRFNDGYKNRGVRAGKIYVNNGHGLCKYDNLLQYVEDYPARVNYPYKVQKVSQLGETIIHHIAKSRWDLNVFGYEERMLNLNHEVKRVYPDIFKNGQDFLDRNIYGYPYRISDLKSGYK